MPLFVVEDRDRWGYAISVVRAENEHAAKVLAGCRNPSSSRVEATVLENEGEAAILWGKDESPDSNTR